MRMRLLDFDSCLVFSLICFDPDVKSRNILSQMHFDFYFLKMFLKGISLLITDLGNDLQSNIRIACAHA